MPYIYNDEDNAPMNDEAFAPGGGLYPRYNDCGEDLLMKYTGYQSEAEARYYENGGYEADLEAKEEARRQQYEELKENLLDELKLEGGCRECPYILETAEGFIDENGSVTFEQKEFLRLQCSGCHGKGTGNIQPEHEKRLIKWWDEIVEWATMCELKPNRCPWCPKVYEVYGKYKDPDDEWRALEDACGNCKYFGEE